MSRAFFHQALVHRALAAELLGSALLLATVVGSGIMAERLAGGNVALALLANTIATGAVLVVLIESFGPLSGAQFNPAVTLALAVRGRFPWGRVPIYVVVQIIGAVLGVWLAHAMFDLPVWQWGVKMRAGGAQFLSEIVATATLLTVIFTALRHGTAARLPVCVALTVTAAYWFTASTSFANPAVTLARSLSDSFVGIRPLDAPLFILAQLVGAGVAVLLDAWFARTTPPTS